MGGMSMTGDEYRAKMAAALASTPLPEGYGSDGAYTVRKLIEDLQRWPEYLDRPVVTSFTDRDGNHSYLPVMDTMDVIDDDPEDGLGPCVCIY